MHLVATLSPIEEILSKKILVDPFVVEEYVKENFAFTGSVKAEILNVGLNDIYFIGVGSEKYVLRLSRANLQLIDSSLFFELAWLEFLNDRQIPVSFPIRRIDNQLFGIIEAPDGPRNAALFSFAEGSSDLNEEQAFILGSSLAKLHIVSEEFKTNLERNHLNISELIDQPLIQIKMALDHLQEKELKILDKLGDKLKEQISILEITEETYGIIAGDIHGYNQHFTKDNQLTMFDFEFCGFGYRVYDVATFRWSRGSNNQELWNAFLNGYQSIRKLEYSEVKAIDAFVQARNLWWISFLLKMPEFQSIFNEEWKSAFSQFETYLLN